MTVKHKNLKTKIASLSALGAGALVVGVGTAEASIVYVPVNAHIGFGLAGDPYYLSPGIGLNSASFSFFRTGVDVVGASGSGHFRAILASACGCFKFATSFSLLKTFNVGAVWAPSLSAFYNAAVGGRSWAANSTFANANSTGLLPFVNKYSLFKFEVGPDSYYGWIHLSYSVSGQFGDDPAFGPDVFIQDFAWNDTPNELIAAGDAPEPTNFVSTGLAALALGATGLRRWRKTRKAA